MGMKNEPLSSQTICRHLKKAGLKAVGEAEKSHFSASSIGGSGWTLQMPHQYWTVDDWKTSGMVR